MLITQWFVAAPVFLFYYFLMGDIKNSYLRILLFRFRDFLTAHLKRGKIIETFFYLIVFLPFHGFMRLLFRFDPLFYPQINTIKVEKPIIVLGHHRSGTTYLQQLIAGSDTVSFSTFRTLLFPSLIMMKLFTPIAGIFNRMNLLKSEEKGHKMALYDIEEDEGLFLHTLNSEMITVFCPWMITDDYNSEPGIRAGWNDERNEEVDILFLKDYIKRQLVSQGKKRSLLKSNPSVLRIKQILKHFPDARFVYIYRDPSETIPSFFSLHYNFVKNRLNKKEMVKYLNNKYVFSLKLYFYFEKIKNEIPDGQLLTVKFNDLRSEPDKVITEIFRYADLNPDPSYIEILARKREEKHSKKHTNIDFSFAGFSKERIESDFCLIKKIYG